jgi:hypothetical protein
MAWQSRRYKTACLRAWRCNNLLHSANFAGLKSHLDAMRMIGGICQDILHDPARSFSSALILFLDDIDFEPGFYVFSILTVHTLSLIRK